MSQGLDDDSSFVCRSFGRLRVEIRIVSIISFCTLVYDSAMCLALLLLLIYVVRSVIYEITGGSFFGW